MGKGGGGGGNITGYRYSLSMLMGLCRGPVDFIKEIRVGDLVAWSGSVGSNTTFTIDQFSLFGGDQKEGGIEGDLTVMMGAPDQDLSGTEVRATVLNSTVSTVIADGTMVTITNDGTVFSVAPVASETVNFMSSLRGVATMFYKGLICSNNPNPKPWMVRVQRALNGWHGGTAWYPAEAVVALQDANGAPIYAMNGIHILYECLTNPVWGRGMNPASIDETSFIAAANALCREQFGLCLGWTRSTLLGDFVQSVVNHIGAALYTDRGTGLYTCRLLRADYVIADLVHFDYDTGLLSVEDDQTTAPDNSHSEIVVKWHDPVANLDRQTRVQNLAGTQANQTVTSSSAEYLGIPTAQLAARIGQRDLALQAPGIKRLTMKFDRRGRKIAPGSVFRVTIPDRNISDMIMRAGKIEEGSIDTQVVTVTAVQDVFGMDATTYLAEAERAWMAPDKSVKPITAYRVDEATYRDAARNLTTATLNALDPTSGDVMAMAAPPTPLSTAYELDTAATGEAYVDHGTFVWCPSGTLTASLGYYDSTMTVGAGYKLDGLGTLPVSAWLDSEILEVTSYDATTGIMDINRGCVDTIPVPHTLGGRIWFPDFDASADGREYAATEEVRVKLLTQTNSGALPLAGAVENTVTIVARQGKPYVPGNFQIDGTPFADVTKALGDVVFTWNDRDRVLQADQLVSHTDAAIGPEAGVTYTTRIYSYPSTLIRTTTTIAAETWTYDTTMASADGDPSHVTVELEAVRDSLASFQKYNWSFYRVNTGYGDGYGSSYGKA